SDFEARVIAADPPWEFEAWSEAGQGKSPSQHYPVMTTEQIAELRVPVGQFRTLTIDPPWRYDDGDHFDVGVDYHYATLSNAELGKLRIDPRTIVADPPWESRDGYETQPRYPTMPTDEIAALPIKQLAGRNCVLFLWTTWPKLFDAKEVMAAWGF